MNLRQLLLPTVLALACVGLTAKWVQLSASDASEFAAVSSQVNNKQRPATQGDSFSPYVDQEGNIRLPKNYKQKWAHLGSWAVAKKPSEEIHEMHDVYTQPETIAAFSKTGEFPDGAVLVKEVCTAKADRLTTGQASWSGNVKIWFVMIKDHKERFQDNDHWGDGWGWALFEAKDPSKNVSAGYDSSCIACHSPVEDSDWVYVYGYPELSKHQQE